MSKMAGFVHPAGDRAYFFRDDVYVRYGVAADAVEAGYPKPIAGNWPGLFSSGIDAALVWPDGSTYFFCGDQYVKFDWSLGRVPDGYPRPIAGSWPGVFESGIDAAVLWASGNAYFFRGAEYVRYEPATDSVPAGYPRSIADSWPGLFSSGIEAALVWPSGNGYFFSGDLFVRYDPVADRVVDGYPLPIAGSWPGLPIASAVVPTPLPPTPTPAGGSGTSVRDYFPRFSAPLEGRIPYMYQDIKGLVTVAVGNLIDSEGAATALPFVHRDTSAPASRDEIAAEWHRIKDDPTLAQAGHPAAGRIATLVLTETAMDAIVQQRFDANESRLAHFYPDWASWPADARLGAHSIAWAGAYFPDRWPNFNAAATAHDWAAAAGECSLQEAGNPGVVPRNVANRQLFNNAAAAESRGLDRAQIYYPQAL